MDLRPRMDLRMVIGDDIRRRWFRPERFERLMCRRWVRRPQLSVLARD
jgi:hypothetical protein